VFPLQAKAESAKAAVSKLPGTEDAVKHLSDAQEEVRREVQGTERYRFPTGVGVDSLCDQQECLLRCCPNTHILLAEPTAGCM
jgi:hypothetical protein